MIAALLLSNSTNAGGTYLEHADDAVAELVGGAREVLFAPWALADHDGYEERVAPAFARHGATLRSLHRVDDPASAIRDAEVLYTGGGNTFRLVAALHRLGLIDAIRAAHAAGLRYGGASAGSVVASPSMRTTNDMPIVEPASFATLGLVPFQINAHYLDADPDSTHAGETRELRLREFLEENDVAVLGLREGTWLRLDDGPQGRTATVAGRSVAPVPTPAVLLSRGESPREVTGDVTSLLSDVPTFDS